MRALARETSATITLGFLRQRTITQATKDLSRLSFPIASVTLGHTDFSVRTFFADIMLFN
jgi:hypothetical protein